MTIRQRKIWLFSGLILACGFLFFRLDLCLGMIVGMIASAYNYSRTTRYVDHLLHSDNGKKGSYFFFLSNYVVMILAFCIAAVLNEYISFFTVALGLFWIKPVVVITEARKR